MVVEDSTARPKPLTRHGLAWQRVREFFDQEMVWTLADVGFVRVDGQQFRKEPFTRNAFTELCLRWQATSLPSSRSNVRISEEVATDLSHLSAPEQIAYASQVGWSRLGLRLDDIFSGPTIMRNDVRLQGQWGGSPTEMRQDEYLYRLILAHLEGDVYILAAEMGMNPHIWMRGFQRRLGMLADQRFPGLGDHTPV